MMKLYKDVELRPSTFYPKKGTRAQTPLEGAVPLGCNQFERATNWFEASRLHVHSTSQRPLCTQLSLTLR